PISCIYIYKKDAQTFYEKIGFIANIKNEKLSLCQGDVKIGEGIPYLAKIVKDILKENNLPRRFLNVSSDVFNKEKMSNITLGKIIKRFETKIDSNDEKLSYLKYVHDNIYFDKIKKLTPITTNTYCLEMQQTHKFIQNGFHGYNCQGSQYKVVIVIADKSATY